MKRQQYIVYVTRDDQGYLQKVPIPMRYAYVFVAAAVVGLFTITGLAGSYTRMLLKTEHFNQIRSEREALRRDYQRLQNATRQKDVQVASLGSLANEVSALYGLRQSRMLASKTTPPTSDSSEDTGGGAYATSLDRLYALRATALSGVTASALSAGLGSANTLTDWVRLADAPSLWPVIGRITSSFGERTDPMSGSGEGEFHRGIDIAAGYGDPIHAAADGVVESAGMVPGGYGRKVVLNHGYGTQTLYAHLSVIAVTVGETVRRGQIIGYVGQSGRSTAPHLHYEVRIHGTPVNPYRYMRITPQQMIASAPLPDTGTSGL